MTTDIEQTILKLEKEALDLWADGNAVGYGLHQSEDCTYCDNLAATDLLIGKKAIEKYAGTTFANLPKHRYKMHNPQVQLHGNVAVLGYQYHPTLMDGQPGTNWMASVVYIMKDGNWKGIHAHWTMLKE